MQKLYVVLMFVVLISCTLFSCTWESIQGDVTSEPTTYVPLSYYPVYPGSWWLYEVNDTTTEQVEVSATYLPHRYINAMEPIQLLRLKDIGCMVRMSRRKATKPLARILA